MEIDLYKVWLFLKEKISKNKVFIICVIELICLTVYSFTVISKGAVNYSFTENGIYGNSQDGMVMTQTLKDETAETIDSLRTVGVTLNKGIYDITVRYVSTNGGTAEAFGQTFNDNSMWKDAIELPSTKEEVSFQIWVNDKTDETGIEIRSNGGELVVDSIQMKTTWNSMLYLVICFILKICFLDLILFGIMFRDRLRKYSVPVCGILGITFICSLGLFTRYLLPGHDFVFHMNRIEGLKDGLMSGMFPVRIQPTWNNGWGYAVSVMYGDLTILFPALMRICGFTVQTTWKTFVVAVNLATALISYYSFRKICRNRYKVLFATLIYCTGLYRLACIYLRAAVGEFTVMMFLPLVVLGFWYAFEEDISGEEYGKKLIAPVIGFTGMLQTHILTCEMCALFIIVLGIIMMKKVLRRKTLLYFAKIALFTIAVNLWFLVPFVRFGTEDLVLWQAKEVENEFQLWGLSVTELFATEPSNAYGFTFAYNVSLAYKCTFAVGLALWGGAVIALFLLWNKKVNKPKAAAISFSFGVIAAFMATNLFPYSMIKNYFPHFAAMLFKIQFPYRFLGLTSLFFTLAVFFVLLRIRRDMVKPALKVLLVILSVLAVYQGMDYQYQVLYSGICETKYSAAALDTTYVVSGEYLYQNSYVDVTNTDRTVTGNGAEIFGVQRESLNTSVTCRADQKDAYIEVPTFYYPGYTAVDDSGKHYKVLRSSNNNRIRINLAEGFEGTIRISYQEPLYWRICEIISLIALIGLIFHRKAEEYFVHRGNRKWVKKSGMI